MGWMPFLLPNQQRQCTIVILCLECFHCYVIIIDCLLTSFDMLYFSTDGCINKSLTYLLTYMCFMLVWHKLYVCMCVCIMFVCG